MPQLPKDFSLGFCKCTCSTGYFVTSLGFSGCLQATFLHHVTPTAESVC